MERMTVKDLIKLLSSLDMPDYPVVTEGCDCYGRVVGVRVENLGPAGQKQLYVIIARPQSVSEECGGDKL